MTRSETLLAFSIVLAGVFVTAGVAKLLDTSGSREAARAFGLPDRLAGVTSRALPLAEIAVAVLLLPASTRWWGAVAALALLLAFCAAIALAMVRGKAPDCHCFGQLHSAPAGWKTLVRNGLLAAIAAFIVAAGRDDPGAGAFAWASALNSIEWLTLALAVTLAAVVAIGGYALAHVMRSYGRVLLRLEAVEERLRAAGFELEEPDDAPQLGLEPGTTAPAFWLPSTDGDRVALSDLLGPGRSVLLVFTSPTCGPCRLLMPDVARWQQEHADTLTVALLSDGDPEVVRGEAAEHGLANVLIDEDRSAYEAYGSNGTPSAVLVADDGTIASWLAAGGRLDRVARRAGARRSRTHARPARRGGGSLCRARPPRRRACRRDDAGRRAESRALLEPRLRLLQSDARGRPCMGRGARRRRASADCGLEWRCRTTCVRRASTCLSS